MISETSGALRVRLLNLVGYYNSTSFPSSHVPESVLGSTREAKSHTLTKEKWIGGLLLPQFHPSCAVRGFAVGRSAARLPFQAC